MRRHSKGDKDGEKSEKSNSQLIYSPDAIKDRLSEGKPVVYRLKYEGSFLVTESRGVEPVRTAFKELRKTKEERRKHGIKHTPIKEFVLTLNDISIRDPLTKEEELNYSIRSISYIVNDEKNRNYIGMIAQIKGKQHFECTILKHDEGRGRDIVSALGIAFDLAYDRNIKNNNNENKKRRTSTSLSQTNADEFNSMKVRTASVTSVDEVTILKARLRDLAILLPTQQLKWYLKKENISEITEISKQQTAPSNNEPAKPLDVNLIDTEDEIKQPSVGTKLENLLWEDTSQQEHLQVRRRSSTGAKMMLTEDPADDLLKRQEEVLLRRKVSEGGTPIPREDPFDMGDFNAVSFPEFDDFYTNLNETDKANIDLLA